TYITVNNGSSTVTVKITLTVKPRPPIACIDRNQGAFTFTNNWIHDSVATGAQVQFPSQTERITNCGDTGDWSARVIYTNDGNWLRLDPTSGHLQSWAGRDVSLRIDSSRLEAGTHTATIQFKIEVSPGVSNTT